MNKTLSSLLALGCGLAFAASSAQATLVTWNLNPTGANAPVGSNTVVVPPDVAGNPTITARGYDNSGGIGSPHELYFKNEAPGESGLGLNGTPHFELQVDSMGNPLHFIQLDLRSILPGFTGGKIEVGSVQAGESWFLYGSNTQGTLGTKLNIAAFDSSTNDAFVTVPSFGTYKFLSVVSGTADVLPVAFQANVVPIPEAASIIPVLCLISAATAFEARRRRRASV